MTGSDPAAANRAKALARRRIAKLEAALTLMAERDPEQEVQGIAIPILDAVLSPMQADGSTVLSIHGCVGSAASEVTLTRSVNGEPVTTAPENGGFSATVSLPPHAHYVLHSPWRAPYGSLVTMLARDRTGRISGLYTVVGGVG